jgi:hypothetical protein
MVVREHRKSLELTGMDRLILPNGVVFGPVDATILAEGG